MTKVRRSVTAVLVVAAILLGSRVAAAQATRPVIPCAEIVDAAERGQSREDIRSLSSCAGRGGEAAALRLWDQPPEDWRALEALALASAEIRSPELLHQITTVVRSQSADRATRLAAIAAVVSRADSRVLLIWRAEYPFSAEDRPAREYAFVADPLVAKIASYVIAELGHLPP